MWIIPLLKECQSLFPYCDELKVTRGKSWEEWPYPAKFCEQSSASPAELEFRGTSPTLLLSGNLGGVRTIAIRRGLFERHRGEAAAGGGEVEELALEEAGDDELDLVAVDVKAQIIFPIVPVAGWAGFLR